ncbi:hypothetical protein [Pimelobacter simplex]|uniref:hypothetical protein n=1 Tax=Nocardioides simplex TaxID=2045 RepID=UPI003AABD1E4
MKTPHRIAALGAALFVPLALVVSAAHADSTLTGSFDGTEPTLSVPGPDIAHDRCGTDGGAFVTPAETISFTSQSDGPRRFAVRQANGGTGLFALFVYRNGVCVAADVGADTDDPAEAATGTTDVENVLIRKGDAVVVRIASPGPVVWRLDITQPGTANAVAVGKGASYVKLPYQVSCSSKKAVAQVAGKAKARKIKSITFTAGGKKVAEVKGVRAGQKVRLKGVPSTATSIKAVVKLKGGGKAKVVRAYSACR